MAAGVRAGQGQGVRAVGTVDSDGARDGGRFSTRPDWVTLWQEGKINGQHGGLLATNGLNQPGEPRRIMPYDEDLAARVPSVMGARPGLGEKKMFGGLAFMLNGNMGVGVTDTDLMVRVGTGGHAEALALPRARPMDFRGWAR